MAAELTVPGVTELSQREMQEIDGGDIIFLAVFLGMIVYSYLSFKQATE